jgi:hypothetical protein
MVGLPKDWDDPPQRPTISELFNSIDFSLLPSFAKRKERPMDRATGLRHIAKRYGLARVCKMIVMENSSHGITEHELTELIDKEAQTTRKAGERPEAAFARFYSAPENVELRKAIQIAKSFPRLLDLEPTQVGGRDATGVNDASEAYDKLTAMADELRRRTPELSPSQAFARTFEANPDLAARAHKRPTATTDYAFPT